MLSDGRRVRTSTRRRDRLREPRQVALNLCFDALVPMARIERATSPLPRECSTTEPHGHRHGSGHGAGSSPDLWRCAAMSAAEELERETGIEPASLAWKAKVLPLNYSRFEPLAIPLGKEGASQNRSHKGFIAGGGGGWIRTNVGVSQQIYSLPPLATRAPLRSEPQSVARGIGGAGRRALGARRGSALLRLQFAPVERRRLRGPYPRRLSER